ncbi:MAG: oxygenase MpaB family protein [Acidobacteriota bacterium]
MLDLITENLEPYRLRSDELGDAVIAEIFARGDLDAVNQVFRSLVTNHQVPDDLPPEARDFFESTGELPSFADPRLIAQGQQVFTKFGPTLFMVLFCKALTECYSCWRGAEVLYRTGRMVEQTPDFRRYSRRLMETGQFVTDALSEGGLDSGGRGIVTIQKLRLIHASIRHYLLAKGWDRETFGVPINWEDEVGTLMAFSLTVLEGLEMLEVELSPEEKEGFLHTWIVIGHLLGMPPELLPQTLEDARALKALILKRHIGPSEAGRVLTRSAAEYMAYLTPGTLFDGYPETLMRTLVSEDVAQAVSLQDVERDDPQASLDRKLVNLYRVFNHDLSELENHSSAVRGASRFFERHLLQGILGHFGHTKAYHFTIPPSLRGRWKVES